MNTKLKIVFMLCSLAALAIALAMALPGCSGAFQQLHGETYISSPTALVTGPATGHWEEQNDHAVITYTVLGTDCTQLSKQYTQPTFDSRGTFTLGPGVTLCVMPLRADAQHIIWHAEKL